MKARFSYLLLFLPASVMAAAVTAVLAVGAVAGGLWLYVYGDRAWPQASNILVATVAAIVFLAALAVLASAAYLFGRKREPLGGLKGSHIVLATGISALLPALVLLHQRGVGNIGPRHDSVLCADFCIARRFQSSLRSPDDTCHCLRTDGTPAVNVPMAELRSGPAQ